MRRTLPWLLGLAIVAACSAKPLTCYAEDDTPSIFGYALEGFGTGVGVGLASSYLLTRPHWHAHDWRTLVIGTGIGALSGAGLGIILGVVDASTTPHGAGVGFYIMRDSNLGVGLGFLVGGVVGAIMWASHGSGKDMLLGMSYGVLIGAGAGVIMGIIEGVLRRGNHTSATASRTERGLSLDLGMTSGPGSIPLPAPMLTGRF